MLSREQLERMADKATEKAEAKARAEYPEGDERYEKRVSELMAIYYAQMTTPPTTCCPTCGRALT